MRTRKDLENAFYEAGIRKGDIVLVHSSLRKLGPVEGGADTVIDALLAAVGTEGTLAMPAHTWKTVNAQQPVFHQALSIPCTGVLGNVFRLRPGVLRSLHPTHSLCASGPRAAQLIADDEKTSTPCSSDSPYARLCRWKGKVLIIGEDLACCTLFHGCEEWAHIPTAVSPEPFHLFSISSAGTVVSVDLHCHNVASWFQYPRAEPILLKAGALTLTRLGMCELRLLDAHAASEIIVSKLRLDPGFFLPPA